ncbi:MAG TPA: response regulator receiver protein, partial [Pseudonocardia sp.]|nr:response regulator receiver protein [Pseudonocardia sp.]
MIDDAARCGYSRCRAELPPPGPQGGRRRSFCKDRRWDGRTCAQMARAEREALGALGLDAGGGAFALDA